MKAVVKETPNLTTPTEVTSIGHSSEQQQGEVVLLLKLRKEEDNPKQPVEIWKKVERKDEGRNNAAKTKATDDNQRNPIVRRKDQSSSEMSTVNSNGQPPTSFHEDGNLEKKKGVQSGEVEIVVTTVESSISIGAKED
ncbi:OLC1v1005516C1 [Oldenlandia corymbosa var. corymbosa]|uniref:OLC1v1005516C1 n=1 Tax=Oldenlandia corymbosa var. corymbosa TaxID=529605 RepID=A0AAV1DI88_OLDCO|nr:OLC1v1005516C1 [Oldenlandia corymbosa var. corymbosa]